MTRRLDTEDLRAELAGSCSRLTAELKRQDALQRNLRGSGHHDLIDAVEKHSAAALVLVTEATRFRCGV